MEGKSQQPPMCKEGRSKHKNIVDEGLVEDVMIGDEDLRLKKRKRKEKKIIDYIAEDEIIFPENLRDSDNNFAGEANHGRTSCSSRRNSKNSKKNKDKECGDSRVTSEDPTGHSKSRALRCPVVMEKKLKKRKKKKQSKDAQVDDKCLVSPSDDCLVERDSYEEVQSFPGFEKAAKDKANKSKLSSDEQDPDDTSKLKLTKEARRVRFSDHVEVFESTNRSDNGVKKSHKNDGIVRGKKFSDEEDAMIKEAVSSYILEHNLGAQGVEMISNSKKYPEIRGCWSEIAAALPWRPQRAVYTRGLKLHASKGKCKFKPEELEMIQKHYEKNGSKWREIGDFLGRYNSHVRNAWQRIKLPRNKGRWSQDEIQKLFDLVNADLQMKAVEQTKASTKKLKEYGMLRDNIGWSAISDKLVTRPQVRCCTFWYHKLSSPLVQKKLWADIDDYMMVDVLLKLDACCIEDVDWDNILKHRSGEICRKRWIEMTRQIGESQRENSFLEQVELLSTRYCPEMVDYKTDE